MFDIRKLIFFEEQLKQGIFQISYCERCNDKIWPTKEICHVCFKKCKWKKSANIGFFEKKSER